MHWTKEGRSRVVTGSIAESSVVALDEAIVNVVGRLTTDKEAISAKYGISGESRTLEDVEGAANVESRLLVHGPDNCCKINPHGQNQPKTGFEVSLPDLFAVHIAVSFIRKRVWQFLADLSLARGQC